MSLQVSVVSVRLFIANIAFVRLFARVGSFVQIHARQCAKGFTAHFARIGQLVLVDQLVPIQVGGAIEHFAAIFASGALVLHVNFLDVLLHDINIGK